MTNPAQWMEDCDFVYNVCQHETGGRQSRYILGQDENGDLFVPLSWAHPDELYRPFNKLIPLHWLAYMNSWRRREMATLEHGETR
jgi:hypothetical protein